MTNPRVKSDQEPGQDQKQDQDRGTPCLSLAGSSYTNGGLLIGYECGKKTGWYGQWAFAAYPRQAKSRLSAVFHGPVDRAGILCHFSANANPHPIGIRCPPQEGACIARHSGFVAASRQFKSFWLRTPKPLVPIWKNLEIYPFILAFRIWNCFPFYLYIV